MRSPNTSLFIRVLVLAVFVLFYSTWARADSIILETASLGPTGNFGGIAILSSQFLGHRFHLDAVTPISGVGGHLTTGQNGAAGTIFAAIVVLSGPTAFPAGLPFAPGEVLASTLINVPTGPSQDVLVPLPITLPPGDYLVVFGSGLFGATGEGSLTTVNPALMEPIFTVYSAHSPVPFWVDTQLTSIPNPDLTMRIVVQAAVPEEATLLLLFTGLLFWIVAARKLRQATGGPPE